MGRDEGAGNGAGSPGRRRRPPLVSRRQAVDAAYQLIDAEGPAGLSMRKLATALHVSLPTVYTAVDSRETLIGELQDRMVAEIGDAVALDRLAEAGGLEKVAADVLSWAERHPRLARFLIVEPLSAAVAERARQRATPEQRAAAGALLARLAGPSGPGGNVAAAADRGEPGSVALAYVFAQVRAMLWLALQEPPLGVDPPVWLDVACANLSRGLSTLATARAARS